ncbi:MAG: hypothetical protein ACHRXM_11445 [Isosphaerales bacterium]
MGAVLLAAIIVLGLAGQVIRDRSVPMAILMYLPVLPAGLAAVALDLAQLGGALPRARFALTLMGAVGTTWVVVSMLGAGAVRDGRTDDPEVSVLHWNVQWGGGLFRSPRTWAAQRAAILGREPDIVILSELPPADWIEQHVERAMAAILRWSKIDPSQSRASPGTRSSGNDQGMAQRTNRCSLKRL